MFDHKNLATDGLYPGLTTTQSVANRGYFLGDVTRKIKKIITATRQALSLGVSAPSRLLSAVSSMKSINNKSDDHTISMVMIDKSIIASTSTKNVTTDTTPKTITGKATQKKIGL
jgi:hypothetical protein